MKRTFIILAIVTAIAVGAVSAWLFSHKPSSNDPAITSFEACVAAGNPVQLSYPEVCATPDGKRFSNPEHQVELPNAQ